MTTEVRLRDTRYVVGVPRVPSLTLVVFDKDEIAAKTGAALVAVAAGWDARTISQMDVLGTESLETITLTLPEPEEAPSGEAPKLPRSSRIR